MKYVLATIMVSIVSVTSVYAQFEAQLSQYMFHIPTYNPAAIGEDGMINVSGQYRMQWLRIPGAPQTTYFTVNAPFKASQKVIHGLGIKFLNDKIGAFSNQSAHFQYAYKRNFGKNMLSLGADIGFVNVNFVYDSIKNANISSEFHKFVEDTAIPTSNQSGMSMDLSLGAFYTTPKYYLGLSYVHLNAPLIKMNDDKTKFTVRGILFATGGYDFEWLNPRLMIRSTTLLKTDFASWQAEISSRLEYNKKFWGGLSYRYQDAVVFFGGLNVLSGLTIGYSYDLPTGKILKVSSGSHELFVSYSFVFDLDKNKNKYKSIRIL